MVQLDMSMEKDFYILNNLTFLSCTFINIFFACICNIWHNSTTWKTAEWAGFILTFLPLLGLEVFYKDTIVAN